MTWPEVRALNCVAVRLAICAVPSAPICAELTPDNAIVVTALIFALLRLAKALVPSAEICEEDTLEICVTVSTLASALDSPETAAELKAETAMVDSAVMLAVPIAES